MQKLLLQRWVSLVRLVRQQRLQQQRYIDQFGWYDYKLVVLKYRFNRDDFFKTAAENIWPQQQQ